MEEEGVIVQELVESIIVQEVNDSIIVQELTPPEIIAGEHATISITSVNNPAYPFSWGDATPVKIFRLPPAIVLLSCRLVVQESWNAIASTVEVGTELEPGKFMGGDQSRLTIADTYRTHPSYSSSQITDIWLKINLGEGNSTGKAIVILSLSN